VSRRLRFSFRLYVAGHAPNGAQAIANLSAFCRTHLKDRFEIEVVDVFQEPRRALLDAVFMTPLLVVLSPPPTRRVVGTLSQTQALILALGVAPLAP
jgi:circadian clock protein KaiB